MAKQIAEALEAAREQDIIHRDLNSGNVKVRPDGTLKVLDFGLAKAVEPADTMGTSVAQSLPTITSPVLLTRAGMLLGTAAYMAPEQARGKAVDQRADIWAFGCVLFELLTPRVVFEQRYHFGSAQTVADYDVSADGQRFVMVKTTLVGSVEPRLNWLGELKARVPTK
jgi:serine/threonine protein kinase